MKEQLKKLHDLEGQFTIKELAINGTIVMKECKLEPGKQLGEILEKAFLFARDNPLSRNNPKDLLAFCKQVLKSS